MKVMEHKTQSLNAALLNDLKCEYIIFDIDGTIITNQEVSPEIQTIFKYLNSNNIQYGFLSNDSSSLGKDKALKLEKYGIPCSKNWVLTAADLLKIQLNEDLHFSKILYFGKAEQSILSDPRITEYKSNDTITQKYDCIVLGENSELSIQDYSYLFTYLVNNTHIPLYVVNPDNIYSPSLNTYSLCAGAILQGFVYSFNDVGLKLNYSLIGKPNPKAFKKAAQQFFKLNDYENIYFIGDSYRCDIVPSSKLEMKTILVSTGIGKYTF